MFWNIASDSEGELIMTALVWDKSGEKIYQTGLDRGVLFLQNGTVAVWNGLISVEETTPRETKAYYLDGVKYLEYDSPGDFSAKLTAFTYPDEFDEVNGILQPAPAPGLHIHDQPLKSFNLSYRTKIGDDLIGTEAGYLLHIIFNVLANPDSHEYSTLSLSESAPTEFSWTLSAKPVRGAGLWRPTAHISIDSREVSPGLLQFFEEMIYGTNTTNPSLPTLNYIYDVFVPE